MDSKVLAEEFLAACFSSSATGAGAYESREIAEQTEDGRSIIIASNPRQASAAIAVELKLDDVARQQDGEHELSLLQASWDERLRNGFVAVREPDGKDHVALVVHASEANAATLASSLEILFGAAENPVAAAADEPASEQSDVMWLRA